MLGGGRFFAPFLDAPPPPRRRKIDFGAAYNNFAALLQN
jgi:hypothetical protein